MSRVLPAILLCALSSACTRTEAASSAAGPAAGVRVEVMSKKRMHPQDGEIFVHFRVVNGAAHGVGYPGWADDSPAYSLEVQEGGEWTRYSTGWCGNGLIQFTLKPGAEMAFDVGLPADGKTYRANFGDPLVVTPPVVAEAP